MKYEERPNYNILRKFLDNIMKRKNYNYDYIYDWTTLEEKEFRKHNRTKTEPTGETMSFNENEQQIYYNEDTINNNIYHIERNNKLFENKFENNRFENKETAICSCFIF